MKSSANPLVGKKHADEQGQICESTGAGTSMASHRRRPIKKIDRADPALTFRPVNPVVITTTNCPSSPTTAGEGWLKTGSTIHRVTPFQVQTGKQKRQRANGPGCVRFLSVSQTLTMNPGQVLSAGAVVTRMVG